MGVRNLACTLAVSRLPLIGAGRALAQFPIEAEQVFQVFVAPLGGRRSPGHFQTAGDGIAALAGAESVAPAKTLLLEARRFRFRPDVVGRGCAPGLPERVSTRDPRHRFPIVSG